jgi:hypothetical protein
MRMKVGSNNKAFRERERSCEGRFLPQKTRVGPLKEQHAGKEASRDMESSIKRTTRSRSIFSLTGLKSLKGNQ